MINILSMTRDQLNKVHPEFGNMLIEWLPHHKGKYIMLHQSSTTELFNSPMPHQYKQVLEVFIHNLNFRGYHLCQIIK